MVVKFSVQATPVEIEQLKNLLEEQSFYTLALKIGVSEGTIKKFYRGEKVTEHMATAIQAFLRRQSSIKDNVAIRAIVTLQDTANLVITKGDTMQRETYLECLEKAIKGLKSGKMISLKEELENLTPCVLKLV